MFYSRRIVRSLQVAWHKNVEKRLRIKAKPRSSGVFGDYNPQAAEIAKRAPMLFYYGLMTQTVAGIAAAAGEQWGKAVEHFETSLRQAHEFPHKLEQPQVRYWYARMLTDRNAPGDRDKARQFLGEAIEAYETIDFPRHREMAKELLGRL